MSEEYPTPQAAHEQAPVQSKFLEPPFGAEVIHGDRYPEDMEMTFFGLLILWTCAAVAFVPILIVVCWDAIGSWAKKFVAGCTVGVASSDVIYLIQDAARKYNDFGWGADGEDRVVEYVRRQLDNQWIIFTNFHPTGQTTDVDLVLVGRGGVYAVELKRPRQNTRCIGKWERETKDGWVQAAKCSYSKQARAGAKGLRKCLEQQGITCSVIPIVALVSDHSPENFVSPGITIWLPSTITNDLAGIRATESLPKEELLQIQTLLKAIAQVSNVKRAEERTKSTGALRKFLLSY